MAETQAQTTTNPKQNPNATPPVPAPASVPDVEGKKRKMELEEFYNSDYCKLRRIVHDLRPLFLEVLQTPDFKTSNVANDIRKQMNAMVKLSQKMRNDMVPNEKPIKREEGSSFDVKSEVPDVEKPQAGGNPTIPSTMQDNTPNDEKTAEMKELAMKLDEQSQGSYVVGGSAIGWNFLVYHGSTTVYYGETKESFRARHSAK